MTERNHQRLVSSIHSSLISSYPKFSHQQSAVKSMHKKRRHSAKSMTIIHTKIRPKSNSTIRKNSVDIFPTINDLINANQRRRKSAQSADIKSRNRSALSQDQQSNVRNSGRSKIRKKRLSKLTKVVPYNNDITLNSTHFNQSSKTIDEWSSRRGSRDQLHDIIKQTKKRRKLMKLCSLCSPICLVGFLLLGLLLGVLLAVLLIQFLPKSTTIQTSSSTSMNTTSITITTKTTTTTTTSLICNSTCESQSWLSSANLLAEWQFDNNVIETISNTNTPSDQSPVYTTGYINQGLLCDANANQSLTSSPVPIATMSFTIDAWIYPTGFPNPDDHSIVGICPTPSPYECLHITIHKNNSGNYILYFGFYGDDCLGSTYIIANEWIHVAFVFDTNSLIQSIYLNGVLDATRTAQGIFKGSPDIVTIGNIPLISGPNYFQGIIDRIKISDRVKASCEILEEATLATYFSFDSSGPLTDLGPNSLSAITQSVSYVSTGHSLQAISFSGTTSSYFQISGLTGLGTTNHPFSISFWVRPQSLNGTLVHISANASGLGWCMPFIGFSSSGSIVAQMLNSIIRFVVGPAIPLAPAWTHIVQTWGSANGLRLYVNNVLVASTISMANSYTASGVPNFITLANSLSGTSFCNIGLLGSMSPFNGDMDEFRVYSRELNADDICTLYTR